MIPRSVVIVGAGLAGSRVAETLRAEGYYGRVVLIGEEKHAPYERPALQGVPRGRAAVGRASRGGVLDGAGDRARARHARRVDRPPAQGRCARDPVGRDRDRDGRAGTSSSVRRAIGVHTLRTVQDAEALRAALHPAATSSRTTTCRTSGRISSASASSTWATRRNGIRSRSKAARTTSPPATSTSQEGRSLLSSRTARGRWRRSAVRSRPRLYRKPHDAA